MCNHLNKGKRNFVVMLLLVFGIVLGCSGITGVSATVVRVHYIDVGQADSILIQSGGSSMLIDAGNRDDDTLVVDYIKKQGIKKLDYIIGTHPHEDHIGGLSTVIDSIGTTKVMMPKVTTNTKTFEKLLTTIKAKGLKITTPMAGSTFKLGYAKFTVLAPNSSKYDELNNYSIVVKMTYGSHAFLFQGDAESLVEQEILKKGIDVKADVIKLGHHGSGSSSSSAYLNKVKPKYAIISCGKDNDYGHPHKQVLNRLVDKKIKYFRTDSNGTIVCTSDGKTMKFSTTAGSVQNADPVTSTGSVTDKQLAATKVYITKSGEKYHMDGCSSLSRTKIEISLKDATAKGYGPCSICKPPR